MEGGGAVANGGNSTFNGITANGGGKGNSYGSNGGSNGNGSGGGTWVQTSYNTHGGVHLGQDRKPDGGISLRKNYAGIGYIYDSNRDAFIPPRQSDLATLNEETCLWEMPEPKM